jgi:hypothetical protein
MIFDIRIVVGSVSPRSSGECGQKNGAVILIIFVAIIIFRRIPAKIGIAVVHGESKYGIFLDSYRGIAIK